MLVKLFASVAMIAGLMLTGAGSAKVATPAVQAKPCPRACGDCSSCPLTDCGDCCMDGPCCSDCPLCPDCPVCCGGGKATVKAAKAKPAACGECPAGSKCCVK